MTIPSDVQLLIAEFVGLGLNEDSARDFERSLARSVTEPAEWIEVAASLRRQGVYRAAMFTYEFAERRFPMNPELQNNRGLLLLESGLLEEALVAFTQAVRLRPSYVKALTGQGHVLELLGRYQEAESVYRTVLAIEPGLATAWNNKGNCLKQLGRKIEARACYEKAIEIDDKYVIAMVNLALLLVKENDRAAALVLLDRALVVDPDDEVAIALRRKLLENAIDISCEPPAWDQPATIGRILEAEALRIRREQTRNNGRVVPELLRRSKELNDRAGFLAWWPSRLQAEPVGDPGPGVVRLPPPTQASPRLFLSYAWARDKPVISGAYWTDQLIDTLAGHLFNLGYQIVFDRDPRNLDKGLTDIDLLRRMYDCIFFVPFITEEYLAKIAPAAAKRGLAGAEWDLACQLTESGFLVFIGLWLSGELLPYPLSSDNTADLREGGMKMRNPNFQSMFPPARPGKRGIPRLPAPIRPPEPANWPLFRADAS